MNRSSKHTDRNRILKQITEKKKINAKNILLKLKKDR